MTVMKAGGYAAQMKRNVFIRYLRRHGVALIREGSKHSIYGRADRYTAIPRHQELEDNLVRKICKDLGVPFVR